MEETEERGRRLAPEECGATFVNCVVDQICADILVPELGAESSEDLVTVSAESHREWIIEDCGKERLKSLLGHQSIKFVPTSHIDLYELRKLWLINGFHLSLAVLGFSFFKNTGASISQVITSTAPLLSKQVKGVQKDLVQALIDSDEENVFKRKDIRAYAEKVKERFGKSSENDTCSRILRDAILDKKRIDEIIRQFGSDLGQDKPLSEVFSNYLYECIFGFFKKVQERIYAPSAVLFDSTGDIPTVYLSYILQELVPFLVKQGDTLRSRPS